MNAADDGAAVLLAALAYEDAPLGQEPFGTCLQPVGVQSYARPVFAAQMVAGPDEVH